MRSGSTEPAAPVDESSEILQAHVPSRLLRRLSRRPALPRAPESERFPAAVLFADISGFTTLTEDLSRQGAAGAEAVQRMLNRCFGPLVDLISEHGGEVVKFAGDATLALWAADKQAPAEAVARAARCALEVQAKLDGLPVAEGVRLRQRLALAAGEVWTALVGGLEGRWEALLGGEPLAQIAGAMAHARPGDVVLSAAAWRLAQPGCDGRRLEAGHVRLANVETRLPRRPSPRICLPAEAEPALRSLVPRAVVRRVDAGLAAWLAEFRRVTVLFASAPGLERDDSEVVDQAHELARAAQRAVYRYGGSINQLIMDDKGTTVVAAWGQAQHAFEDDAVRALLAAMAIHADLRALAGGGSVGVATGRVFTGRRGNDQRMEFALIGDVVNLAARLMQATDAAVLCDRQTFSAARSRIRFETLNPIAVKGKAEPVEVFRPTGERRHEITTGGRMIGRDGERRALAAALQGLTGGDGGVVVVEGEAGIGKSTLIADLLEQAASQPVRALVARGDAIERAIYHPWREVFAGLLGLDDATGPEAQRRRLEEWLSEMPDLAEWAPLLDPVLPFSLADNEVTGAMPSRSRAERMRELLVRLFEVAAGAGGRPTLLVVEDAHWLDSASWALAEAASRRIESLLIVVATRPVGETPRDELRRWLADPSCLRLELEPLASTDLMALVRQRLGVESLPPSMARLIEEKASGHPLFAEELASAMRDRGLIEIEDGQCRLADAAALDTVSFPDTVQGVVTNRIDGLTPKLQLCLKVASVIGRDFERSGLAAVDPMGTEEADLGVHLESLMALDLLERGSRQDHYAFKHAIIHEVAYDLLPYAQRRRLHRPVAEWYERRHEGDLAPVYPLLAHHWGRAEVPSKAVEFAEKAGKQALAGFANQEAVRFFDQAKAFDARAERPTRAPRRARWEASLCRAHLGLGQVPRAREAAEGALALLRQAPPASGPRRLLSGLAQSLLQAGHRLFPRRFLDRAGARREQLATAVDAYLNLAMMGYWANEFGLVLYSTVRALNLGEAAGPSPELARIYGSACNVVGYLGLHSLAARYRDLGHEVAAATAPPPVVGLVNQYTGHYAAGIGDWRRFDADMHRALELYDRYDSRRQWEEAMVNCAYLYMFRGELRRGLETFQRMEESARQREDNQTTGWALLGQGRLEVLLGRFEEALEHIDAMEPHVVDQLTRLEVHGNRALAALRLGDRARAREEADRALELIAAAPPASYTMLLAYSHTTEVYLSLWAEAGGGRDRAAARKAKRMCAAFKAYNRAVPLALAHRLLWRGTWARLNGDRARARRFWRRALEAATRLEMPLAEALVRRTVGEHAKGKRRRSLLEGAAEIYERMGAGFDAERARALLADRERGNDQTPDQGGTP